MILMPDYREDIIHDSMYEGEGRRERGSEDSA